MRILSTAALHGLNIHDDVSVLEATVDCRDWSDGPTGRIERARALLDGWLPHLAARRARADHSGGGDDWPPCRTAANLLKEVSLELQNLTRAAVVRGRTYANGEAGIYQIVIEFHEERLARECLETAHRFCLATRDESLDVTAELRRLRDFLSEKCLGGTTGPIVLAARARGIACRPLNEGGLVQLGHGSRQRRIRAAVTSRTGKIAEEISLDKDLTKQLLDEVGIPVPKGRTATNLEEAWEVALEIGLPVVIKPRDADYGRGVSLNLTTRVQVEAAVELALQYRDHMVVESYTPGDAYRLLVVDNGVVGAVRRDPPTVVGDGIHTVGELITLANRDPRRSEDRHHPLRFILACSDTDQVLGEQGLHLGAVPAEGQTVLISRLAHICAGAALTDVMDVVHPEVVERCIAATRLVGLDVAGIDLVTRDITQPLEATGGVLVEINAQPATALHFPPYGPVYRPVSEAIVESLFPPGETGRIPIAVIAGGDTATTGRVLAALLGGRGLRIGRASEEGLWLDGRRWKAGSHATLNGNRALLLSPETDAAVLERSLKSIHREGLGLDACDIAVLTFPERDVPSTDLQAALALRRAAGTTGRVVLDADHPAFRALADSAGGPIIEFSADFDQAAQPGLPAGKRVRLHVAGELLFETDGTVVLIAPLPAGMSASEQRLVLAAAAAAWAAGVSPDGIRRRLAAISWQ